MPAAGSQQVNCDRGVGNSDLRSPHKARVAQGGVGKSSRLSPGSWRCAMTALDLFCTRELAKMLCSRLAISGMGGFRCIKIAERKASIAYTNPRTPPSILPAVHPLEPRGVVGSSALIGLIKAVRCLSEITNSVVASDAVSVVDLILRPHPISVKPRQAMCRHEHIADRCPDAVGESRAGHLPSAKTRSTGLR